MISALGKTLLHNPSTSKIIAGNDFLTCVFLNLARPELLLSRVTEKFSPWFRATEYRGREIQIQRVYSFMYGRGAWAVRVSRPSHGGWDDLGTIHHDVQVLLQIAQEHIDEVKFCELTEKIQKLIEIRANKNPSS